VIPSFRATARDSRRTRRRTPSTGLSARPKFSLRISLPARITAARSQRGSVEGQSLALSDYIIGQPRRRPFFVWHGRTLRPDVGSPDTGARWHVHPPRAEERHRSPVRVGDNPLGKSHTPVTGPTGRYRKMGPGFTFPLKLTAILDFPEQVVCRRYQPHPVEHLLLVLDWRRFNQSGRSGAES
jgi:hypothetical protein